MTTEDDVPFPTDSSHTQDLTTEISADKAYHAVAYLKDAMFSDYVVNKTEEERMASINRMKSWLMDGHAVSIMLYMTENYVNVNTSAYCYPTTSSSK